MQEEQEALLEIKARFDQGSKELVKTLQEDDVFALEVATQLQIAHLNVAKLQKLVSKRSSTALEVIKDNEALLEMVEESAKQEQVKEALNTQQVLMNELLNRFNKMKGEPTQWERWCVEALAKVGELRTTNTKLSKHL